MTKVDALVSQWRERAKRLDRYVPLHSRLLSECADELEAARAADRVDVLKEKNDAITDSTV